MSGIQEYMCTGIQEYIKISGAACWPKGLSS